MTADGRWPTNTVTDLQGSSASVRRPPSGPGTVSFVLDADCTFVAVDEAFATATGYESERLIGEHASFVYPDAAINRVEPLIRTFVKSDHENHKHTETTTDDGPTDQWETQPRITLDLPLRTDTGDERCYPHQLHVREHDAGTEQLVAIVQTGFNVPTEPQSGSATAERGLGDESVDGTAATAAIDRIEDGFYVLDSDLEYTYINERARELLGLDGPLDRLPGDAPLFQAAHERAMELQEPLTVEASPPSTDSWLEARLFPDETGVTVEIRDRTLWNARECSLKHRRKRLAALDHVHDVVHELTDTIVTGSPRETIERTACESLADSPSYEFAFVAAVDPTAGSVSGRAEAGIDGYLESIPLSIDSDDEAGRGPLGRAVRTQEPQVSNDVLADPDFEPWRDDAREHGYRAAAAIPIAHDGALYGVLGVTSARRDAFVGEERTVLTQLGDILGHAIDALERKQVLLGETVIELELVIDDVTAIFDGPTMAGQSVCFDRVVRIDDDRYLEYGTTTPETFPDLERLVDSVPHWDGVTVLNESADEVRFELAITSPPVFSKIDAHGGYVKSAALCDGDYAITMHFPRNTDVRAVTDAIDDVYSGVRTVARRQISPGNATIGQIQSQLAHKLTDRQRISLETAYYAGFFEWPRDSSGTEIAATLDISPATFHEHLRTAQRKLVEAVVEGESEPVSG